MIQSKFKICTTLIHISIFCFKIIQNLFLYVHIFHVLLRFISPHGEDKNRALLSYKLIDKNEFFPIPPELNTIDKVLCKLENPKKITWPCSREEEQRWEREVTKSLTAMPIYNCSASEELSCSLTLNIMPWCLFINSTGSDIKIAESENFTSTVITSNSVAMSFYISVRFCF